MITHPFHPLNGQRLTVLFSQRKRTGLYFVCEVEGRRRVTVAQEWTDRGLQASADRLAVDGLTAARSGVVRAFAETGRLFPQRAWGGAWAGQLNVEAKPAANDTQKNARPVREGTALCQGIIFCGVCGGPGRHPLRPAGSQGHLQLPGQGLPAPTEAEAALATAQAAKPPPATDSLQALAQDVPRLWHAETTSPS